MVTPCVGVWIEISFSLGPGCYSAVTPCVGVWIEMLADSGTSVAGLGSLPAWECGLKLVRRLERGLPLPGHSLRGSVD